MSEASDSTKIIIREFDHASIGLISHGNQVAAWGLVICAGW